MNHPRFLKKKILNSLKISPVVLLTGGRQTGKTTLIKEIAKEEGFSFITLDNLQHLAIARDDPVGFINQFSPPLIIDEVQRAPEIALPIKLKVDENRTPGMYALTGSSNPLVAPRLNDSLAGRMFILNLYPLSQVEMCNGIPDKIGSLFESIFEPIPGKAYTPSELSHIMLKGGYPPVQNLNPEAYEEWFNHHINALLQRDIQELSQIRKIEILPRLLQLLANRSASLLNISELSRTSGIPNTTLSFYLTLLEALYLISRQPSWHKNSTKRFTKSPKIYLLDTGILLYLIGANEKRLLTNPNLLGAAFETFVVMEIEKLISWSSQHINTYHYRTNTGDEVDLILENRAGEIVGIEIKSSQTIRTEDFKGLIQLQSEAKELFIRGVILYPGSEVIRYKEKFIAVPISFFLQ